MKQFCLLLLLLVNTYLHSQTITTIAGTGTYGYSGDGGLATQAQLADMYYSYPAFDSKGNIYIAQNGNNTIRKIDSNGIITTIAGTNGTIGYTGDGGLATNALLYHPGSIIVDKNDNIIFADQNQIVLRQISLSGIITTISDQPDFYRCGTGDGGPLSGARFQALSAMSIDEAGNIYLSDYGCNSVRKVNTAGIVYTVAGGSNHNNGFSGDGGPATSAQFDYPGKVAVDKNGNIYIPDVGNRRIRMVNSSGIITTIAGTGTAGYSGDGGLATQAQLFLPVSVVVDKAGNLYIGDEFSSVIRKVNTAGIISTFAGTGISGYSGDGGPATLADIALDNNPISIDASDNIYFADRNHSVIRKINNCLSATLIKQPEDVALCNSGNANFTVKANDYTSLQWQVDVGTGWIDISDNNTYIGSQTASLQVKNINATMDHYHFRCVIHNACGIIYSATTTLSVTTPTIQSITIATPQTQICAGTETIFTANITHPELSPVYQWKKNGTNIGDNSSTFKDNTLLSGDIISCTSYTGNTCVVNPTAKSNAIIMQVVAPKTPSLTITPSANEICYSTPVTFTSQLINGGTAPVYTWLRNGTATGLNTSTYTANDLTGSDVMTCSASNIIGCVTSQQIISNEVNIQVTPLVNASVSITSSISAVVCTGTPIAFTASSNNEGSLPVYEWFKNNQPVGTDDTHYLDEQPIDGDVIICRLTSNARCIEIAQRESNKIVVSVYKKPIVTLDQSSGLCMGGHRTLDAGHYSSYLWNTGATGQTITVNQLGNYSVTVTDHHGCLGEGVTRINNILAAPSLFLPKDTTLCYYNKLLLTAIGTYKTYLWSDGSHATMLTVTKPGSYILDVIDNKGCTGADTINVLSKQCLTGFFIPTAFSPNGDGINDFLKPILGGIVVRYQFSLYNRWGKLIFESLQPSKGWDGNLNGIRQDAGAFIWTCAYQFEDGVPHYEKGTVVLVR